MTDAPTLPGMVLPDAARSFLEAAGPGMGEYSGEILRAREPRLYQACVELLARGFSIRATAEILHMSQRSVMAVRDNEPAAIAARKEIAARRFLDVAALSADIARDRLIDSPDSISFKDLLIGGAVATDKHLVLSGEATQRIEHVVRPAGDDFARMLDDARRRGEVIEGEIVPSMDMTRQDAEPNGAPAPGSVLAASGPSSMPSLDIISGAHATNATPNEGFIDHATGYDADERGAVTDKAASDQAGGEGFGDATGLKNHNESDHGEISRKGPV